MCNINNSGELVQIQFLCNFMTSMFAKNRLPNSGQPFLSFTKVFGSVHGSILCRCSNTFTDLSRDLSAIENCAYSVFVTKTDTPFSKQLDFPFIVAENKVE